jgi:hypothetical protein
VKNKCKACKIIDDIFYKYKPIKSNYDYWLMTELFVYLHDGKDYCNHLRDLKKDNKCY